LHRETRAPSFEAANGPFGLVRRLSEEMERVFDGLWREPGNRGGGGFPAWPSRESWIPPVEILERNGHLIVRAELPGVKREDVQVRVEDDCVIVEGERQQETESDRKGYYHSERRYGSFYRCIPLPERIDASEVTARFNDGILEVEMPAPTEKTRGRKIPIDSARPSTSER
jgi:HSP20 family protein